MNYWSCSEGRANGAAATRWLIEERLGLALEQVPLAISCHAFDENDLGGMLQIAFDGSLFAAVDAAYPGRFRPWEFRRLRTEWTKGLAIEAMRWLVEERLCLTPQEAVRQVTAWVLTQHNLIMAYRTLGLSLSRLFVLAYPELRTSYLRLKREALGPAQWGRIGGRLKARRMVRGRTRCPLARAEA